MGITALMKMRQPSQLWPRSGLPTLYRLATFKLGCCFFTAVSGPFIGTADSPGSANYDSDVPGGGDLEGVASDDNPAVGDCVAVRLSALPGHHHHHYHLGRGSCASLKSRKSCKIEAARRRLHPCDCSPMYCKRQTKLRI